MRVRSAVVSLYHRRLPHRLKHHSVSSVAPENRTQYIPPTLLLTASTKVVEGALYSQLTARGRPGATAPLPLPPCLLPPRTTALITAPPSLITGGWDRVRDDSEGRHRPELHRRVWKVPVSKRLGTLVAAPRRPCPCVSPLPSSCPSLRVSAAFRPPPGALPKSRRALLGQARRLGRAAAGQRLGLPGRWQVTKALKHRTGALPFGSQECSLCLWLVVFSLPVLVLALPLSAKAGAYCPSSHRSLSSPQQASTGRNYGAGAVSPEWGTIRASPYGAPRASPLGKAAYGGGGDGDAYGSGGGGGGGGGRRKQGGGGGGLSPSKRKSSSPERRVPSSNRRVEFPPVRPPLVAFVGAAVPSVVVVVLPLLWPAAPLGIPRPNRCLARQLSLSLSGCCCPAAAALPAPLSLTSAVEPPLSSLSPPSIRRPPFDPCSTPFTPFHPVQRPPTLVAGLPAAEDVSDDAVAAGGDGVRDRGVGGAPPLERPSPGEARPRGTPIQLDERTELMQNTEGWHADSGGTLPALLWSLKRGTVE